MPPQDDLIYIARQILAHTPPGDGRYLLVRDPYLMMTQRTGTLHDIIYWISVPELWARAIPPEKLHVVPPLDVPAQLLVKRP